MPFETIDDLELSLRDQLYLADRGLATSIFLSLKLERPLFLEGEAGVGKTEVAKALASSLDTELIRLQCYEGLDVHHAVYEWNYTRQMLHIRMLEARGERPDEQDMFGQEFLLSRPLLKAIEWNGDRPPVLLIDELDRSDEEFEAFLLEILSEFQVTIPEIGTIRAERRPIAIITSNRTREVHDALKRRCLYHWIDYPSFDREFEILRLMHPRGLRNRSRPSCRRCARRICIRCRGLRRLWIGRRRSGRWIKNNYIQRSWTVPWERCLNTRTMCSRSGVRRLA